MKKIRVKRIVWLGVFTLLGFPLLGVILEFIFASGDLMRMFPWHQPFYWQLGLGLALGIGGGLTSRALISTQWMEPVLKKYSVLISGLNLKPAEVWFVSICAGVGEELLFRGVIQPLIGIWITALIFVAIHGYLNPTNFKLLVYGLLMTGIIAALGYSARYFGILSPIVGHACIDIILFTFLQKSGLKYATALEFPQNPLSYENLPS